MTEPATKKRRAEGDATEEVELTIAGAWELMKGSGPSAFKSLAEYVAGLDTKGKVVEVLAASYFKSADMENRFVVPDEFKSFTINRNAKNEISRITDSQAKALAGRPLKKMLAYSAMREKGFKTIIYGSDEGDGIEVLAVPSLINMDEVPAVQSKTTNILPLFTLHMPKSSTVIYARPEIIMDVLSLPYVTLGLVGDLLRTLNSLAGKEDLTDFKVNELVDPHQIQELLGDQTAKASKKHFLQTLFAARISRLNPAERTDYFKSSPSYTTANQLSLRVPHGGPCYTKQGNKPVTAVPLSSLANDADVLMSTNVMSQKDYSSIRGDVAQYLVFVDSEALGGRRQGKWAEMNVKYLEKVDRVREILTAIAASNDKGEVPLEAAPVGVTETTVEMVELD